MELFYRAKSDKGLSADEIRAGLVESLKGKNPKKALLIPPDYTRYYSNSGFITNAYYHLLTDMGCDVDVMPALGSHRAVTKEEAEDMFGDIPFDRFLVHNWRTEVMKIGEVPAEYLTEITEGIWNDPVSVEVNKRLMDPAYDLIISVGQVVPHEVIGMANHSKNIFVGIGGSDMINKSHMVGACYGMERMMGRDFTPVRKVFDYALEHYLADKPIVFALTVTTAPENKIVQHGLFIGDTRKVLEEAVALAQEKNIDFVEKGIKKCVVYLDPKEFQSTWLGNKAVYRTRMAVADDGDLIILAPGITHFGEDEQIDKLIRKYGYCGRVKVLELFKENQDLQDNMGAAAHLIHGSSDGRFRITYATKPENISREEIEGVDFIWADYGETAKKYNPEKLQYGYNTLEDGEEIFFIPNPALGLWIDKSKFND